jgi:hypothetical protein
MAVAGAGAGTGLAAPGSDIPYTKRLQILEALATRYPGHVEAKNQLGRYGLWAGIVAQTTWQQRTHRDRIPLWAIVNYSLSVQPTGFATLLEHAGTKADPASVCALRLDRDVCRGWAAYFAAVRKGQPPQTLLKLLWHAHTTAIVDRLHTQRAELDKVHTTPLERRFWASWIEIVFLLEASHFPTDGATSTRASALLMPPCSPLGAPGCRLRVHDLGHTYPFVSVLARRRSSVDRALREYTTLRTNPAALQTLAISDPKLASALALYLAVAR